MPIQNPGRNVSKQDLAEFYQAILPYLGGGSTVEELPEASETYDGKVFQYVGDTTQDYTQGFFYQCQSDGEVTPTYSWVNIPVQEGGGNGTVLTQTLTGGTTSVTFTGIPTTGDNLIDFFTSTGINYTAINNATAGQVTLTFDVQASDVIVYCKIEEVTV